MQPNPIDSTEFSNDLFFKGSSQKICKKCNKAGRGDDYETIYGKRTLIRVGGYIGAAYDSFVTTKLFICDQCLKEIFKGDLSRRLLPGIGAVVLLTGVCAWPAIINLSTKAWGLGFAFVLAALVPGLVYWFFYLSDFQKMNKYVHGIPQTGLTREQIEKVKKGIRTMGEREAKKINEQMIASSQDDTLKEFNLFLTPAEYKKLLQKSTTELPHKK